MSTVPVYRAGPQGRARRVRGSVGGIIRLRDSEELEFLWILEAAMVGGGISLKGGMSKEVRHEGNYKDDEGQNGE